MRENNISGLCNNALCRDALYSGKCKDECLMRFRKIIHTINPESLRPKGEWIVHNNDGLPYSDEYECPICGIYYYDSTNFCSHCGADMRGDKNETN